MPTGTSTTLWPGSVPWKVRTDTLLEGMFRRQLWRATVLVLGIAAFVTAFAWLTRL